jgi:hypothetical protein
MQTYIARSAFTDPTNISNAISVLLAALALQEVRDIIPAAAMPYILALSGLLNIVLRTFFTVRPVAAIAPGQTAPVAVESLTVTQPDRKP